MKVIVLLFVVSLVGCSTQLTINSVPDGAKIAFKGKKFVTPFTVKYSNMWGKKLPYILYKENYETQYGNLPSKSQYLNFILVPVKGGESL